MSTDLIDPVRITDYHIHVYYDPAQPGSRGDVAAMGGGTLCRPHGSLA